MVVEEKVIILNHPCFQEILLLQVPLKGMMEEVTGVPHHSIVVQVVAAVAQVLQVLLPLLRLLQELVVLDQVHGQEIVL